MQSLYESLFAGVDGITVHAQPAGGRYDSNFWLCTIMLDPELRVEGQSDVYKDGVTDCQPNDNVEALRVFLQARKVEVRPVWKPMHKQPVYHDSPAYVNGVSESVFRAGLCLPAGPYVSDDDVRYIVGSIKEAIRL